MIRITKKVRGGGVSPSIQSFSDCRLKHIMAVTLVTNVVIFLSLVFVVISAQEYGQGKCIWFDSCGKDPDRPDKCLNCYYDGAPKKLDGSDAYRKLYEACPHFK